MKNNLTLLFLIIALFSACKKENEQVIEPIADFSFAGDTTHSIVFGPCDFCSLTNNSKNADSYLWDLGNGITSTQKDFWMTYDTPGKYKLSLTATNKNGKKSTIIKEVSILTPVIKDVVIDMLGWNSGWGRPVEWPLFTKANVWVEILKGEAGKSYPVLNNGSFDAPVVFKSEVVNIDSASVPVKFTLSTRTLLDVCALTGAGGYRGTGYGFNIYAQDASGVYLLSSSYWSGGISSNSSINNRKFSIRSGVYSIALSVNGVYE